MTLSDSVLVRTFDFTRVSLDRFGGWNVHDPQFTQNDALFYRWVLEPGYASYARGCQIVRPLETHKALLQQIAGDRKENKEYASFIAQDFRHMVVREISCGPGATANYFEESDLPFETSPAFFRAEVLAKYKADSEKYRLEDRSVTCRGAWHLQTFDINAAGQVHTYLCYLRTLPFEEQLHWKAYNEPPKGNISARAFRTDFEGNWDDEYDPLPSLRNAIDALITKQVAWWTLRDETLLERCHYPVTTSADEWMNELLLLDQLLVEGFEDRWLRQKAQALGRTPQPSWRSLKLLEECLIGLGFEEEDARKRVAPFRELHDLRSKLKGHAAGQEAAEIKRKIRGEWRDYREHFRKLCATCDESLRAVIDVLNER